MQSLSEDIRVRIIRARERGDDSAMVAERFEVSIRTVQYLWKRYRESGEVVARQRGGYLRSRVAAFEAEIRSWIKAQADITLVEMCGRLEEQGVSIKAPGLWYQLNKWGLSFKKNSARQRARTRGRTASAA